MEPCVEGKELTMEEARKRPPGRRGCASVTVELVGFLRDDESRNSGQQLVPAADTAPKKGFAIRRLPRMIAEMNNHHHRSGGAEAPGEDGGDKRLANGFESGVGDGDDDVRQLAQVIQEKNVHDHCLAGVAEFRGDDAGAITDREIATRELAAPVVGVGGNRQRQQNAVGDRETQDVEERDRGKERDLSWHCDDGAGGAAAPSRTIGRQKESREDANGDAFADDSDGGRVVVMLPKSDSTAGNGVTPGADGRDAGQNSCAAAAEAAGLKARDGDGGMSGRCNVQNPGIGVDAAECEGEKETERRLTVIGCPEADGMERDLGGDQDGEDEEEEHRTKIRVLSEVAPPADDRSRDGIVKDPLRSLSPLQRLAENASSQVNESEPVNELREVGGRNTSSALALARPPLPPVSNGKRRKVTEQEVEKAIARHPRWTKEESVILFSSKRKCEEEERAVMGAKFGRRSAMRHWDSVSDSCRTRGVDRDVHQCRKRWSNLTADFKKIQNWQRRDVAEGNAESYWSMLGEARRINKLPGKFDRQIFAEMERMSESLVEAKEKPSPAAKNPHQNTNHEVVVALAVAEAEEADLEEAANGGAAAQQGLASEAAATAEPGEAAGEAAATEEDGSGRGNALASVVENNGRSMQAALLRGIHAQVDVINQNSELDRKQRKEQNDNLVGVLSKMAESLGEIALRL